MPQVGVCPGPGAPGESVPQVGVCPRWECAHGKPQVAMCFWGAPGSGTLTGCPGRRYAYGVPSGDGVHFRGWRPTLSAPPKFIVA